VVSTEEAFMKFHPSSGTQICTQIYSATREESEGMWSSENWELLQELEEYGAAAEGKHGCCQLCALQRSFYW
jgi:hypothetical protein